MRSLRFVGSIVLGASLALAGCSANNGCTGTCDAGRHIDATVADDGAHVGTDVANEPYDPTRTDLVSIAITPANPTLTVTSATPAVQHFLLTGTRRDGTSVMLATATWSLDSDRLGTIGGDGTFTANGVAAGIVQVKADAPGAMGAVLHATTMLTVVIHRDVVAMGAPMNSPDFFTPPPVTDASRQATVLYPLDGALMPNNVAPPDVQWSGGNSGDLYRIEIVKPHVSIRGYVMNSGAAFTFDWMVDGAAWNAVLQSDPDAPAVLTVDRYDASTMQVIAGTPLHLRFAHGAIFGDVYYWDLDQGHLLRIDAVTAVRQDFMPHPPPAPTDSTNHCVACHAISNDGRYLSAELWGGGQPSTVFDLTADLSVDPAPTVFAPGGGNYLFSSFNPMATRVVTNPGTALVLLDPLTGSAFSSTNLPGSAAAHPAWAPDNGAIAFIDNIDGGWAVDFTNGDLAVTMNAGSDTFASPMVLHTGSSLAGATEGGSADSHPSWSPDSAWIAFGHGTHSRSNTRDTAMNFIDQPGAVYLISRSGGTPTRLDNADGGPSAVHSYWPTFSPFQTMEPGGAPGYYWLAFYSRRDYGNAQAGTLGTGRRQLWVTAVTMAPTAGADPSNVPYWLPGQDFHTNNMAAYWAPQPCRMNGATCEVSSECCSGMCLPDPTHPGQSTCQPPPPSQCHPAGATCGGASDCCMGLMCNGNVCVSPPG